MIFLQVHGNRLLELVSHWEGQCWTRWWLLNTVQFSLTFLVSLFRPFFSDHCLPQLLIKTKSLSTEGYANDRRSFVAIFCLTFLLSFSIQETGSQFLQKLFSCCNEYDIQTITSLLSGISSPRNVMRHF